MLPAQQFDVGRLTHRPVAARTSFVSYSDFQAPGYLSAYPPDGPVADRIDTLCAAIRAANERDKPVILFMGAHPIKLGLSRHLNAILAAGRVTHLALTGAAILHDWEVATHGETSEDVAENIDDGTFGMWAECAAIADCIGTWPEDFPFGSHVAVTCDAATHRAIYDAHLAAASDAGTLADAEALVAATLRRDCSILSASCSLPAVVTAHFTPGADIWQLSPAFADQAAAAGKAAWADFLFLANAVEHLDGGGVFINMGSAVAGPELFLKALAMARNAAGGKAPRGFTTAVFDVDDRHQRQHSRWHKNVLVRPMIPEAPGLFVRGDFRTTVPVFAATLLKETS